MRPPDPRQIRHNVETLGPEAALVWARGCARLSDDPDAWVPIIEAIAGSPPPARSPVWDPPSRRSVSEDEYLGSLLTAIADNPGVSDYALCDRIGPTGKRAVEETILRGWVRRTVITSYGSGKRVTNGVLTITPLGRAQLEKIEWAPSTSSPPPG